MIFYATPPILIAGFRWKAAALDEYINKLKDWNRLDKENGQEYMIHYHGRPVLKIGKAWAGALKRAKITRRIRPYDLRHHFITRALEAGADLKAVAEVVGSRPETIMKHYEHVTGAMHRQAVAKIPALDFEEETELNKD